MPDPAVSVSNADRLQAAADLAQKATSGQWFNDAPPAADIDLDALFPNPETVAQQPDQAPVTAPATTPDEPFLKLETGTLYKTRDEAIRGYTEKDRYISQLRQELEAAKANSPKQPEPARTPSDADISERLYDNLAAAAGKGDKKAYVQAQAELINAVMAPYAPILADMAREKAIRQAETRTPGIREFMGSETYNQVTERVPLLKQAIAQLQNDPLAAQAQLDQLLELAKLAADGMRAPDLAVQAATQAAAARAQTTPRQTLQPSTPTPAPQTGAPNYRSREDMLRTSEGRKALIEQYKDRVANTRFDDVGL